MRNKKPLAMFATLVALTTAACSGEVTTVEYDIPDAMCEDVTGTGIPQHFFPPGEDLHHNGVDLEASPVCRAFIDGEMFLRFEGNLDNKTLEENLEDFNIPQSFPREGDPINSTHSEYEIQAWPHFAVASRTCTSPYREKAPVREFKLLIGAYLPEDVENPQEELTEFIGPAAETLFDRVTFCEESPAYDPG